MLLAKDCFTKAKFAWENETELREDIHLEKLQDLKEFLDIVHIRSALIKPYNEHKDYPIIDTRSLIPSFDNDPYEYHELPGFSMLVLDRQLHPFTEIFQYDPLFRVFSEKKKDKTQRNESEEQLFEANMQTMLSRLSKRYHDDFKLAYSKSDFSYLDNYPHLLNFLFHMDRAHVMSKNNDNHFQLSGIFASFPSDLDGELKRYGLRIGKFQIGDSKQYLRNRLFTLQFLMELYGFPIASERRTSSALFARKLHKSGESFMIRVIGQSDRTITSIWTDCNNISRYPYVEKIALVVIEDYDSIKELEEQDAFLDKERHIAIGRVRYLQHVYSPTNVRQDRACSIQSQSIIHPITGQDIQINFLREMASLVLSLNDISNGEFQGRTIYKRTEIIDGTETEEKRLKVFYAWLLKNQRRIISYSDDSFSNFVKLFKTYFENTAYIDEEHELYHYLYELKQRYLYISQARKLRFLEELITEDHKEKRVSYYELYEKSLKILNSYKLDLSILFDDLLSTATSLIEVLLNDRYILNKYLQVDEDFLTERGFEIRHRYMKLQKVYQEFVELQKQSKVE